MRPVTKPLALLGASFLALAVTAVNAQDGLIRSDVFPPVPGKKPGPVSLEESKAILKTLGEVPDILTANLHDALDAVTRSPRTAKGIQRDVSLALSAITELHREALAPFRAVKGFPRTDLETLERKLEGVQELERSVKDDIDSHEGTFIRGDANGDGTLDMSDALKTFGYLYLGGAPSECLAAADANDDEVIDISDPVGTLNTLFLGAAPLPPPTTEPGVDPTPGLGCAVGLDAGVGGEADGGGATVRNMGPISIDRDLVIHVNCFWVCIFVCTPNFCLYYCYSSCVIF